MKEGLHILQISKETAMQLNEKFGIPYGENGISTSKPQGKTRHCYLCETKRNLKLLKELQK